MQILAFFLGWILQCCAAYSIILQANTKKMANSLQQQRNKEIGRLYNSIVSSSSINMALLDRDAIFDVLMSYPAPRFYITPKMAERYILGFKRQLPAILNSRKLQMIEDLVATYESIKAKRKHSSNEMIWRYVVESPAKSFYISRKRAEEIIFNYKGRNGSK